jgi:hypothetical protein
MPAAMVLGSHTVGGLEGVRLIGTGGRSGRARLDIAARSGAELSGRLLQILLACGSRRHGRPPSRRLRSGELKLLCVGVSARGDSFWVKRPDSGRELQQGAGDLGDAQRRVAGLHDHHAAGTIE